MNRPLELPFINQHGQPWTFYELAAICDPANDDDRGEARYLLGFRTIDENIAACEVCGAVYMHDNEHLIHHRERCGWKL